MTRRVVPRVPRVPVERCAGAGAAAGGRANPGPRGRGAGHGHHHDAPARPGIGPVRAGHGQPVAPHRQRGAGDPRRHVQVLRRRGRLLPGHEPAGRAGQRGLLRRRRPHRRRPGGLQRRHGYRHLQECVGQHAHRLGRQPVRLRGPGPGRLFLRRDGREAGAAALPADRRGVHHLRPADPPVGSDQQDRHHQPRRLRLRAQHAAEGQGRAGAVPARDLLPDPGRRPRHRLPAAQLRHLDAAGPGDNERILLGHRSQPGRDIGPRLVHPGRLGPGRGVPLRRQRPVAGQRAALRVLAQRDHLHRGRGHLGVAGEQQLPDYRHGEPEPQHAAAGPGLRGLFFRHRHPAPLQPEHLPGYAEPADDRGQPQRLVRRDLDERPLPTQRVPDRRHLVHRLRQHAARLGQRRAADAVRHADLCVGGHRVRAHPQPGDQGRRGDVRSDAEPGRSRADAAHSAVAPDVPVGQRDGVLSHHLLFPLPRRGRRPDGCGADATVHVAAIRVHRPGADEDLGYARRARPPSG